MNYSTRFSTVALLAVTLLTSTGCSRFSQASRQQRAYAKYVRNSSFTRTRQSMKFRTGKVQLPPVPQPSDPMVTQSSGPESVSAGSE
ncbi:MAG: hypothetical protein M3032_00015 [Verrucomicrobiota bacterium]|nr:hypothetical protein [Verrucomicrobiota bacterium]